MSLNYQISLDSLPIEVLTRILDYARLENVIQLVSHEFFLKSNPNLKTATNGLITSSTISYNNRFIQYSFVHMYKRTKTYLDKDNLLFINEDDVEPLVHYCIHENLPIVLTLSYYVWSLADLVEMVALISNLPNYLIRYNPRKLNLVPGFLVQFQFELFI